MPGHGAAVELANGNIYLAIALRNGGSGLAVHGWRTEVAERTGSESSDLADFHRQQRDLYVPAGSTGFWQGAIRDRNDPSSDDVPSGG